MFLCFVHTAVTAQYRVAQRRLLADGAVDAGCAKNALKRLTFVHLDVNSGLLWGQTGSFGPAPEFFHRYQYLGH